MEANPETITADNLRGFRAAGVKRLSIGVQSFDDRRLRTLGRIHTAKRAQAAIAQACGAGFECVGVDLMFGLPFQGAEDFRADLSEALRFPLGHLSCYELALEPGTPLAGENPGLPAEDVVVAQWAEAEEAARRAGMSRYEVSNYSLPGRECRHNLKYWRDEDFVGLGRARTRLLRRKGPRTRGTSRPTSWRNPPAFRLPQPTGLKGGGRWGRLSC